MFKKRKQLEQANQTLVQTISRIHAMMYSTIQDYERGKIGARPCILHIKGFIEGLHVRSDQAGDAAETNESP